jgi:hypothetical protein
MKKRQKEKNWGLAIKGRKIFSLRDGEKDLFLLFDDHTFCPSVLKYL